MIMSWKLAGAALLAVVAVVAVVQADGPDLQAGVEGQTAVHPGDVVTFAARYSNLGPAAAVTPYVDLAIPSGLPAPIDQLTQQQFDALAASADGTDTLGNTPLLFLDGAGCEHLFFQLQGPIPPQPVQGLAAGAGGSFTFDLPVPLLGTAVGAFEITEPPVLAGRLLPALTNHSRYHGSAVARHYGRGLNCDGNAGGCVELGDCFGSRLSLMTAASAELTVADDGGAAGDPTLGCAPLVGFPVGRIAVMRRGTCTFFDKAANAQDAGASGALIVNDGQCAALGPDSPDCVIDMDGGPAAGDVDIPVIMLSAAAGEAVLSELAGGGTVRATFGASPGGSFELSAFAFLTDPAEVDPNSGNSGAEHRVAIGLFADGLETGTTSDWTSEVP